MCAYHTHSDDFLVPTSFQPILLKSMENSVLQLENIHKLVSSKVNLFGECKYVHVTP